MSDNWKIKAGGDVAASKEGNATVTKAAGSKKNLGQKIVDIISYIPGMGWLNK